MKKLALDRVSLGRVAITPMTSEEVTRSGLILPGGRETLANVGTVLKVCDQYQSASDDDDDLAPRGPLYSVGEVVVIGKYHGVEITLDEPGHPELRERFTIINESDILCTLKEAE